MHQNIVKNWVKHLDFTILDILCLEVAFLTSYFIRNGFPRGGFDEQYQNMVWAIIFVGLLAVFFLNSYEDIICRGYVIELKQTLFHCAFVSVGLIVWMFIFKESSSYSRMVVLSMYPVSVCYMIVVKGWPGKESYVSGYVEEKEKRKVMIISTSARIEDTIDGLLQPYRDYQLIACALYDTTDQIGKAIKYVPVVAGKDSIIKYIQNNVIDEVFIDLPGQEKEAERLMGIFVSMGLVTHVNLAKFTARVENKRIQRFANFMVLSSSMKFATPRQLFFKRMLDIIGALVGLVVTGVAFLVFAPIIKKQSPGPVFFSQERGGRNGRRFQIYKFRTMYPDAEERKRN